MPKPLSKEERDTARKFRKCIRENERALIHFKESDRLLNELLQEVDVSRDVRLSRKGKRVGRFEDAFAKGNTAFRSKSFKQYEPKIVELP